MAQHFEQPTESGDALRAQRMTADESRAVIALWQQERVALTGLTDQPALPDVAEGLDITVEDAQRLLQEVRAKRIEEERALAGEQDLSEIRLAGEERQSAEIRRQMAERRREQIEEERRQPDGERRPLLQAVCPENGQDINSVVPMVVIAICLIFCIIIIYIVANR